MGEALRVIEPSKSDRCPTCNQEIEKKASLTEIRRIVSVYKMVSGYDKDDKLWDRLNYSRCSKMARNLLNFFGNWENAADCVQEIYEKFTSDGLTVTMETIQKHAADWKRDYCEKEGKNGIQLSKINGIKSNDAGAGYRASVA